MELRWSLPSETYRIEVRKQPFLPEYSGLYIYSADSSVDKMKEYLCISYYKDMENALERVDLIPIREDYNPDKDSVHLIRRLRHLYERIGFRKKK